MTRMTTPVPLPVLFVVASFLCPSEFSIYLFGLRLPPHRIALLLLLPFALMRLLNGGCVRLKAFDLLVLLYSAWSMTAYTIHGEETEGLVYGGSVALESLGGYAIARAYIRDAATFMATLKLLVISVAIAGLIALPETLLGSYFTRDFLREFIGGEPMPPVEQRLGLYRATSVFDHPIHLGTFCASLLALVWFAERRVSIRTTCLVVIAMATFASLSSAPLLCLGLQIALIALERLTRGIEARLFLLSVVFTGLYLGAMLVSNRSPIALIATGLTLDSWTGYYRLLIWEYGIDTVLAHPLLGIGLADWHRPRWMASSSVDAFWLMIAMRTGIPAVLLLALAVALLAVAVIRSRRRNREPVLRRIAMGWVISLVALSMAAATVHLWNVVFAYFFFFLGLAGWIADPRRVRARASRFGIRGNRYRGMVMASHPELSMPAAQASGIAMAR